MPTKSDSIQQNKKRHTSKVMNSTLEKPLVSVCMPLYNTELYLSKAIQGILNQTYTNFEFIICDNCSTDRSVAWDSVPTTTCRGRRMRIAIDLDGTVCPIRGGKTPS